MTHLKTTELAEQFGIPQSTLRWWRHRGEGPRSFKLGRTVFYAESDVVAWVAAEKAKTERGGVLL